MFENRFWKRVSKTEANSKLLTGKWISKENLNGSSKARWWARGFSEPFAVDTYAEELPPTSMRMLLAYAANYKLYIRHVDIITALPHAEIDRLMYT